VKDHGQGMDRAVLQLNLWLTQGVVLVLAAGGSLWMHGWQSTLALFSRPSLAGIGWAMLVAILVVGMSIGMERFLPQRWQDDGSINEQLFGQMSLLMTVLVCVVVGFTEEWLFRGVIQSFAGNLWTSVIFTLVHTRYLRKPLLVASLFLTSWLLGELYSYEGNLWLPIMAHILVDLTLAFYLQSILKRRKGEGE